MRRQIAVVMNFEATVDTCLVEYSADGGMLDVVNVSSGQNFASQHFFPNHVLTETYDSAAQISISDKDIGLFKV